MEVVEEAREETQEDLEEEDKKMELLEVSEVEVVAEVDLEEQMVLKVAAVVVGPTAPQVVEVEEGEEQDLLPDNKTTILLAEVQVVEEVEQLVVAVEPLGEMEILVFAEMQIMET